MKTRKPNSYFQGQWEGMFEFVRPLRGPPSSVVVTWFAGKFKHGSKTIRLKNSTACSKLCVPAYAKFFNAREVIGEI
ncbi:hypothetical protein [Janthinobacterium sp. NKUCC06_STL]|uniref:hypothetical protein n=1 Tax=Janthinobacterium sp. NKUCC06_STL TaxID=2842127 RepID=UPI001C5BC6D3|nr:hypothetical protein [Janthinobacterium sp. NKUCC06_STL]MBW3512191.1 hypothetical protein [Janthinobacterium sp. NKUCC06_STL]